MPLSQGGKYFANPQQMRSADAANVTPISKPDEAEQPSITISKTDSGFHTSEPNGDENDFASFDEVEQKAKECLGVEADSDDSQPDDDSTPMGRAMPSPSY